MNDFAAISQLVEREFCELEVAGSSPACGSNSQSRAVEADRFQIGPCESGASGCSPRRCAAGIPDVKAAIGTPLVAGNARGARNCATSICSVHMPVNPLAWEDDLLGRESRHLHGCGNARCTSGDQHQEQSWSIAAGQFTFGSVMVSMLGNAQATHAADDGWPLNTIHQNKTTTLLPWTSARTGKLLLPLDSGKPFNGQMLARPTNVISELKRSVSGAINPLAGGGPVMAPDGEACNSVLGQLSTDAGSIPAASTTFATGGVEGHAGRQRTGVELKMAKLSFGEIVLPHFGPSPSRYQVRPGCDSINEVNQHSRCVRSDFTGQPQRTISSAWQIVNAALLTPRANDCRSSGELEGWPSREPSNWLNEVNIGEPNTVNASSNLAALANFAGSEGTVKRHSTAVCFESSNQDRDHPSGIPSELSVLRPALRV